MMRRVLLGIGGTPFTTVAIHRAVELCRLHDAQLTAVTVVDQERLNRLGSVPVGAGGAAAELREHRLSATRELVEAAIEALTSACEANQLSLDVHREKGDPFELMIRYARYHDVSVFGLRSMFECGVLGNTDVKPADVLNRLATGGARSIIAVSEEYRPIRRVLVAYGGSLRAAETMKQLVRLRLWPDITLRLLACNGTEADASRYLADAAEYCRWHGYEAETCHRPKSAKREILAEAAQWDADLIVLGATRASVITRSLFGTTALHVIRNADRPLFIGS